MKTQAWIVLGALAGAALLLAGCQLTRAGYETAPYRVVLRDGRFELRDYPALKVVETGTGGGDFMRLFRYIDRRNSDDRKIAMTTPVFMRADPAAGQKMAFVLPAKLPDPPRPKEAGVELAELPAGKVAVLRFRGGRQDGSGEAAARLAAWMDQRHLPRKGSAMMAYFDPPWIPGFLRRNEVMIATQAE